MRDYNNPQAGDRIRLVDFYEEEYVTVIEIDEENATWLPSWQPSKPRTIRRTTFDGFPWILISRRLSSPQEPLVI